MTTTQMEKRLTAVEEDLANLKATLASRPSNPNDWVEEIAGTFANDPVFDEAMERGRKWRKTEPGKPSKATRTARTSKTNGR